ncbi:hypothetical protein, partial [Enterobacter quasiroggenkampii]|uniref:hypothetical protein n=1 Tax=Enterobacter quasiroggenkampii TaxID=2497436 RepID=UPI0021D2E73C
TLHGSIVNNRHSLGITIAGGSSSQTEIGNLIVVPDEVFEGKETGAEWKDIPLNSNEGVIVNSVNGSKIGFPHRGMPAFPRHPGRDFEVSYRILDKSGNDYIFKGGAPSHIPGLNGRPIYSDVWE